MLALARATSVRLLYTDDRDLIADFKNKKFIDPPRGKVYSAISEFPKWRKYLILLSFLDNSSARPVQIGGVDVNICHSRVDRSPRTPAVQFAIPSAGAILSHTDGPCGS